MALTVRSPRLHYELHGCGEPLLFITGFGLPCSMLRPLVRLEPERLRWITYDHPGVGYSEPRLGAVTTGRMAAAAIDLLDELKLDRVHVAGLSLGGAVAIELGLRVPERLKSLTLMGTTGAGPLARHLDLRAVTDTTAQILTGSLRRGRLWFGPMLYSREYLERGQAGRRPAGSSFLSASGSALLGQMCAASLYDRSRQLHRLRMPTLILHGERDVLLPLANAHAMAARIPGAELRVIPGAGHAFPLEQPQEVARLLGDWVTRHTPSPP